MVEKTPVCLPFCFITRQLFWAVSSISESIKDKQHLSWITAAPLGESLNIYMYTHCLKYDTLTMLEFRIGLKMNNSWALRNIIASPFQQPQRRKFARQCFMIIFIIEHEKRKIHIPLSIFDIGFTNNSKHFPLPHKLPLINVSQCTHFHILSLPFGLQRSSLTFIKQYFSTTLREQAKQFCCTFSK